MQDFQDKYQQTTKVKTSFAIIGCFLLFGPLGAVSGIVLISARLARIES